MGLAANMKPFIKDALLEIPQSHRQEASDALAAEFGFEVWRTEQDPVVEDTLNNRAEYVAGILAQQIVNNIRNIVQRARAAAANASTDADLGV